MADKGGINGTTIVVVLAGSVLAYSGLKGKTISTSIRALLAGQNPADVPQDPSMAIAVLPSAAVSADDASKALPPNMANQSGGVTRQQIISTLKPLGLSNEAIAGALGNLYVESAYSPTAYNPGEKAIGLAQWENSNGALTGRRTNLQAYAAARGLQETDTAAQLGFMVQELTGPYSHVLAQLKNPTLTPTQAATIWDVQYEGSKGTTRVERVDAAIREFLAGING